MYGKIHSVVYNSRSFDKSIQCNHHHDEDVEQYGPLVVSPFPHPQGLATSIDRSFVPIILPFSEILINGTHTVGGF